MNNIWVQSLLQPTTQELKQPLPIFLCFVAHWILTGLGSDIHPAGFKTLLPVLSRWRFSHFSVCLLLEVVDAALGLPVQYTYYMVPSWKQAPIWGDDPNELWPKMGPASRMALLYREAEGQIGDHVREGEPANLPLGLPTEYRGCVPPSWNQVPFQSEFIVAASKMAFNSRIGCPTASV